MPWGHECGEDKTGRGFRCDAGLSAKLCRAITLAGRVSDVHFTILHAMLRPSSEGERPGYAYLCFAPAVTPTRAWRVARPKCTS